MNLLHLKYFQVVAKTGHMTKAARQLNIAQPALSRSINSLEKELGVQLFNRVGRFIELNQNGKFFLGKVNEVLETLDNTKKEILDLNNITTNEIKLLIQSGSTTIPSLILSYKDLHPNVNFRLIQHYPPDLDQVDYDFCISSTTENPHQDNATVLLEEQILLGVNLKNPLSKHNSIDLKDAKNENFINFVENMPFRHISEKIYNSEKFTPNVVFETDVPSIVIRLIREGAGVSFIPGITWSEFKDPQIKLLKINNPHCKRYLVLSCKNHVFLNNNLKNFKKFAEEYYKNLSMNSL